MELKEFIESATTDIIEAISELKGKYNVKNSRRLHNHFDCDRLQEKEYHS